MNLIDFSNRQNRNVRMEEVSPEYFEQLKQFVRDSKYYPKFHIAPPHGLMNDPNGCCQMDGWFHFFYQWFPLGPVHGLKHWHHVKTKDFLHYEDLGAAMIPDTDLDENGCFTGISIKEKDQWVIYYTGVKDGIQQVCKADFDGKKITNKRLVIPYDPYLTTKEFRDPIVYKNQYMLVGAQGLDQKGMIPVFRKENDTYVSLGGLKLNSEYIGDMIECPNLVEMDEKTDLLVYSPMGIRNLDKYTCRNVFSVLYGLGKYDPSNNEFICETYKEMDAGFDFYAPQIFTDEQGRKILLGWFGNSKCVYPSDFEQWAHMMTLPREIRYKENRIQQLPLEELSILRKEGIALEEKMNITSSCFEMEFEPEENFEIVIKNEKGEKLVFGGNKEEYFLDRTNTTHLYNEVYGTIRYAQRDLANKQKVRIYVDRSAIEIFAEDGLVVFTSRFYLDDFNVLQCTGIQGSLFNLKSIEM